jgi:hypothetical protein
MRVTGEPWAQSGQAIHEFADFTTFTNFLMVPRAQTAAPEFSYLLPAAVLKEQTYRLWLRKQAGTSPDPINIVITLPAGTSVKTFSAPNPPTVDGRTVTFTLELTEDTLISLSFE